MVSTTTDLDLFRKTRFWIAFCYSNIYGIQEYNILYTHGNPIDWNIST